MSGPSVSMDSQTGAPAPVAGSVTTLLMPGTLQTAGGLQAHRTVLLILNIPFSRDILNSLQGIQNTPG